MVINQQPQILQQNRLKDREVVSIRGKMPTHRLSVVFSLHALPSMQVSRERLWLLQEALSSYNVIKTIINFCTSLRTNFPLGRHVT